jgi:hypothetical protein
LPGKSGALTTMNDGGGYWIYMKTNDTLYVNGTIIPTTAAPPSYLLLAGWNLIGFKPQPIVQSETIGDYLSSIGGNYSPNNVWVYDNSGGSWVRAGFDYMLNPGQAMWILLTSPANLRP